MSLRPFRLPADLSLMAKLLPPAFQYPENPDWSVQTDEVESILRLVNSARQLWPLFSVMMKVSPAARDVLHGCVWEEDGQPVGMVNISRDGTTDEWIISNVAVLPKYRRRGIARALVEAAISLARKHHAKGVLLDVIAGNTPAYDLYANLGFAHFTSSVQVRHAAPTPTTPASTAEVRLPPGYATTALSSQAWRPYFELARRITPPEVQRYRPATEQKELRARRELAAEKIMRADPTIGTRELACRIAMATSHRCSESTAHTIRATILARIQTATNPQQPAMSQQ